MTSGPPTKTAASSRARPSVPLTVSMVLTPASVNTALAAVTDAASLSGPVTSATRSRS
jgi:hypothetical protein